jgi:hypothetical protein
MFGSTIIDVAIGVLFSFLAVSLFSSALMESANSLLGLRASTLKQGVQNLLNDPNFNGLAKQLYANALVNPMGPGAAAPTKNMPSYINSNHFSQALMEAVGLMSNAPTVAGLKVKTALVADPQIRDFLNGVIDRTSGDLDGMRKEIADWFDASMDRLSGEFKRWKQLWTFLIALVGALLFNLDSVRIARVLWATPALVDNLQTSKIDKQMLDDPNKVNGAVQIVDQMMQARLPAGWAPGEFLKMHVTPDECDAADAQCQATAKTTPWVYFPLAPWSLLVPALLGWLVTAVAALFGAPFWFDALQSIAQVRGAGPTPDDRKKQQGA